MASLEQPSNERKFYRVVFRYAGRKYSASLKTTDPREAKDLAGGVDKTLRRLKLRLLELPEGADIVSFVLSDGKETKEPQPRAVLTLKGLCEQYEAAAAVAMEMNSLDTVKLHLSHFRRHLGENFPVQTLSVLTLQGYVEKRSKKKGHRGRRVSPTTMRKEIATLRASWNWGVQAGLLMGGFPNKGLKYPKTVEKEPFRTWAEIERRIARGGLTPHEEAELWDCLFLTLPEVEEFLRFAKDHAEHPFLYPMLSCGAHTGARRSELIRSLVDDFDFEGQTVLIREKKRERGRHTLRRVPMSPFLLGVMKEWLSKHPGGSHSFCQELHVPQSGKVRKEYGALTRNEANHHLKKLLEGSKWEKKLRGWHVLRHSFASNCAAAGVDQRLIDSWMGHCSPEMVKRYRHLIPDQEQAAIRTVFATSQVAVARGPAGPSA